MVMWLAIMLVSLAAVIAGIIYLITRIGRFDFWDKIISGKFKRKIAPAITFIIIAVLISYIFNTINMMVIIVTLTIIWMLVEIIAVIIKIITKGKYGKNNNHTGAAAIILSVIYLSYGWYQAHHVVQTEYTVHTSKVKTPVRLVQITDSHLGATFDGEGFARELEKIQACNPDIVVITGDYVDGSSNYKDIVVATEALGKLKTTYGVYYCYGNHDRNYNMQSNGYTVEQLITELEKNKITILQDTIVEINDEITLIGREDASTGSRASIYELVSQTDRNKYIIDLNHQPSDYTAEEDSGVDMVLSGHTHGGQLIPINNVGIYIGATDKIYGREKRSNTEFIVSSGISDWAIDFKTGCKAEYVVVDLCR